MTRYWSRKLLLWGNEATYGTDPTPAIPMLIKNVTLTPLDGDEIKRELERPYYGAQPSQLVGQFQKLEYDFEWSPSGTAGTAPVYGPLLKTGGTSETITATTKVDYDPVSSGIASGAGYMNIDGVQHILLGGRTDLTLNANVKTIPSFHAVTTALFSPPTAAALPATTDFSAWQDPIAVIKANVQALTLNGVTVNMKEFSMAFGNSIAMRALSAQEAVVQDDRQSTGSITFDAESLATLNPMTLGGGGSGKRPPVPLVFQLGNEAGSILKLTAPAVELGKPTYVQDGKVAQYKVPLTFLPVLGNDEWKFTFQ